MPRFDPDERFKLDMEPEQAVGKLLGDKVPCPNCGTTLRSEWDEKGVLVCPDCDYTSASED